MRSVPRYALVLLVSTILACSGSSGRDGDTGSSARDGESEVAASLSRPTRLAWGPDGRLYVATLFGEVRAYRFDDDWNVTQVGIYDGVSNETENEVLGLAFDPYEGSDPTRLYVAHANINSASCGVAYFPYSGRISRLTGPNFDVPEAVVTGLPNSPGSHGVNGLAFDDVGDLYVSVGGVTNAGIADCDIRGMPESPLSSAVVKVPLSETDAVANIVYRQRADGTEDDNQVNGATVDLDPGSGVSVYAAGFRNAFTLLFASTGILYALDNGADEVGGDASTSATTQEPARTGSDSLDRVVEGGYYGHPNRNRGRDDPIQNVYVAAEEPMPQPGVERALLTVPASTNGLVELRTNAWGNDLRGALIAQRWNGETIFVELDSEGEAVVRSEEVPIEFPTLDIAMGPGGALFGTDFSQNALRLIRAEKIPGLVELPRSQLAVFDVHPWRAPASGGRNFVIAGQGFDRGAGPPTVEFGEVAAAITRYSANRIEGVLPELDEGIARHPGEAGGPLIDIHVEVDGQMSTLVGAFLPLPALAP